MINEPIYRDGIANEHDKQVREIRKFLIDHIESQGWFESTSLTKMVKILNFAKPEAEEWDKANNDNLIEHNFCHITKQKQTVHVIHLTFCSHTLSMKINPNLEMRRRFDP
jgi:hypothetical protein